MFDSVRDYGRAIKCPRAFDKINGINTNIPFLRMTRVGYHWGLNMYSLCMCFGSSNASVWMETSLHLSISTCFPSIRNLSWFAYLLYLCFIVRPRRGRIARYAHEIRWALSETMPPDCALRARNLRMDWFIMWSGIYTTPLQFKLGGCVFICLRRSPRDFNITY